MNSPVGIFLPVLLVVALTFVGFIKMAVERTRAIKAGQDPDFYRAHIGTAEPETTRAAVRHWDNLFELPTVFYAGCITAFVLGAVTPAVLGCAWIFALGRLVQSAVHLTYNNPLHRGGAFALAWLAVIVMWALLALAIVARL